MENFVKQLQETFPSSAGCVNMDFVILLFRSHLKNGGKFQGDAVQYESEILSPNAKDFFAELVAKSEANPDIKMIIPKPRKPGKEEKKRLKRAGNYSYYKSLGDHNRKSPIKAEHMGLVQFVRVSLPKKKRGKFRIKQTYAKTAIGRVKYHDHCIFSRNEFVETFEERNIPLAKSVERVELITTARYNLMRFSPIAYFLGFAPGEDKPFCYILESGTALGEAKVLYPCPTLEEPYTFMSGYQPTPFARKDHHYTCQTTFNDKGDPTKLTIDVRAKLDEPAFFQLNMGMEKAKDVKEVAGADTFFVPATQTLDAFLRIIHLSNQMHHAGVKIKDLP